MEDKKIIINVGRQLGSGGLVIAKRLAGDLGCNFYDKELLNLAAKESGFSEKFFEQNDEKKGFFRSLFHMHAPFVSDSNFYNNKLSQESLFQFQSDAIRKAAEAHSCVFVGRCADESKEASRASYYNYYTGKVWGHSTSYDLCINSSILGMDGTVEFIKEFIGKKLFSADK